MPEQAFEAKSMAAAFENLGMPPRLGLTERPATRIRA